MARPGFTHIPLPKKKETVRHISQANPSGRSVYALLHTLILRPCISLRRAQTSESNLSAKTALHAARKNQSRATNALLLILSLFLVSMPCISDRETPPALLHWATLLLIWSASESLQCANHQQRLTDMSSVCDFDGVISEPDCIFPTLSSDTWQTTRRPVRNTRLTMVNDSFVSQSVD